MNKNEALRILEARLASIERDHDAEMSGGEDQFELIDNKAEARTLAAVFDFLRDCKISHTASLLRVLERYLRRKSMTHSTSSRRRESDHDRKGIGEGRSIVSMKRSEA